MSFDIGVTLPAVYDCGQLDAIERAAPSGAEAFELWDLAGADPPTVRDTANEHDISVGGTTALEAGGQRAVTTRIDRDVELRSERLSDDCPHNAARTTNANWRARK